LATDIEKALEILPKTHDGNDLDPDHLKLLELAVNGFLNAKGLALFEELYQSVLKGYVKPWLHGVENLTIDNVGYVYWKGIQVEHYNLGWHRSTDAKKQAEEVGRRCRLLEEQKKEVSYGSVIWGWKEEGCEAPKGGVL
jgi:hypothetical protein